MPAAGSSGATEAGGESAGLYAPVLRALLDAGCPFLVGGAYALAYQTGEMPRPVKDLDLMVRARDLERVLAGIRRAGWSTSLAHPHWLAKAYRGDDYIDVIFASGNGIVRVDDAWLENAEPGELFGLQVLYCPPEEGILSRSFVMERERFDGADVAHLLRACAERLDWRRLVDRFGEHWRVLLSHLVLFGFIYPAERHRIPDWVLRELVGRLGDEQDGSSAGEERVCRGTLLSRNQYEVDVDRWGYADARVRPRGSMTVEDAREWSRAGRAQGAEHDPRERGGQPA
jgi:hypothetical protein